MLARCTANCNDDWQNAINKSLHRALMQLRIDCTFKISKFCDRTRSVLVQKLTIQILIVRLIRNCTQSYVITRKNPPGNFLVHATKLPNEESEIARTLWKTLILW